MRANGSGKPLTMHQPCQHHRHHHRMIPDAGQTMKRADKRPYVRTVLKLKGGLSRLLVFDLSNALEVFGSLVRSTRRGEDCFAVAFQNAQPVADIIRMIGAWFCGDTKITTEECSAKLGNHFFHRVCIITKAFTEGARATCLCA